MLSELRGWGGFDGPKGRERWWMALCHLDLYCQGVPDYQDYAPRPKNPNKPVTVNIFSSNRLEPAYVKIGKEVS